MHNSNVNFLLVKLLTSAVLTASLLGLLLEAVFAILGFVAQTKCDPLVWENRVLEDLWIVYIGMAISASH
jgi:hypothetical protein